MSYYDFHGKYHREGACLIWDGYVQSGGYGQVLHDGKRWLVHRLAWAQQNGQIPRGIMVLHHCDHPRCIELTHLRLGTAKDNAADMIARARGGKTRRPHTRIRKLTDDQVREIRTSVGNPKDIAARWGITWGTVYQIRAGRRKSLVQP